MNIDNVKPGGGVEKHSERPVEIVRPPHDSKLRAEVDRVGDSATISEAGRDTLRRVHDLVAQLREPDADREAKVAGARARLENGTLNTEEVFRSVAQKLLGFE